MTTPQLPTIDSFFSGGGGKSVSWKDKPLGTTVSGTIKKVHETTQQTDYITKKPKFKPTGEPMTQVRIDLATNERDPSDPEDDGSRGLYVLGWMTGAIGEAMRKAGVQGTPQVGAQLSVTLSERVPTDTAGITYNKFTAHYVPPANVATNDFFNQGQQAGQQFSQGIPASPPAPAPAPSNGYLGTSTYAQVPVNSLPGPAPAAQPPTMTPEQVQAFLASQAPVAPAEPPRPPAISEEAWATMTPDAKAQLSKALGDIPF